MKHTPILTVGILVAAMSSWSCKTNTIVDPPAQQGTTLDAPGSAYFPLSANQTISARVTGDETVYDANGSIVETNSVDRNFSAVTLAKVNRYGLDMFGFSAYNDYGALADGGRPAGYIATTNNEIEGLDNEHGDMGIVLPPKLSIGLNWNPDPSGSPNYKLTLTQHLASFTTKTGNTYQDVIQVDGSAVDSSSETDYDGSLHSQNLQMAATLYFANGVGPVEINVHNIDQRRYEYDYSHHLTSYELDRTTGVVSRNK